MDARRRRMLRAASCALAAALVSCCLPLAAFARTDGGDAVLGCSAADLGISEERLPGIDASHAALMDEEGTLWYGRAAGERAQIASLTKIMTAIVAAEHLDAGDRIVVTNGFVKKTRKTPRRELACALAYKADWEERFGNG